VSAASGTFPCATAASVYWARNGPQSRSRPGAGVALVAVEHVDGVAVGDDVAVEAPPASDGEAAVDRRQRSQVANASTNNRVRGPRNDDGPGSVDVEGRPPDEGIKVVSRVIGLAESSYWL
jgi:hypothetical protein